ELESRFAPDVIHLNSLVHGNLPFAAPALTVVHSCVLSWWAAVKQEPLPSTWNRYRQEVGVSLRSAEMLVAPSEAMLQTVRANCAIDARRARVIANGHDPQAYHAAPKEDFVFTAGRLWDEA